MIVTLKQLHQAANPNPQPRGNARTNLASWLKIRKPIQVKNHNIKL